MKKIHTLVATLVLLGLSAPVLADEVGPARPITGSSLQTTTTTEPAPTTTDTSAETTEESSLLEYFVELFN